MLFMFCLSRLLLCLIPDVNQALQRRLFLGNLPPIFLALMVFLNAIFISDIRETAQIGKARRC